MKQQHQHLQRKKHGLDRDEQSFAAESAKHHALNISPSLMSCDGLSDYNVSL
tara:strand:- start:13075 stop:13230 length:156 start_codon:yes stop_codon:yes gene_type:complete